MSSSFNILGITAAVFTLLVSGFVSKVLRNSRRLNGLPGPPAESIISGNILDLQAAKVGTRYNAWAKTYGRAYRIRGPLSESILVITDPKGINHVLSSRSSSYGRPEIDRYVLKSWFGHGLFSAEGQEHKRMRKSLNGAFTPQAVQEISHILTELAYRLKSKWEDRITASNESSLVVNVASALHILSLDAITMATFGYDCSASSGTIPELLDKITNAPGQESANVFLEILVSIFPALINMPSPMKTWATRLRMELGNIAEKVWSGAKTQGMHAKVLELIDKGKSLDGEAISKDEAIAHIIGILFAGSESTANVISECLLELAKNTEIQGKLRAEVVDFERAYGRAPGYDELINSSTLPYLDAVVRETSRTKAVLMAIARTAVETDVIPLDYPIVGTGDVRSIKVDPGQAVYIAVRDGVNVDEEIWGPDATEFKPERWLKEGGLPHEVQKIRAQGHVLTFGDGQKVCLGRLFAIAEIKIVILTLIRHFIFEEEGSVLDFYHLGGNTVKPKIRGREKEGVQLPLRICLVQ